MSNDAKVLYWVHVPDDPDASHPVPSIGPFSRRADAVERAGDDGRVVATMFAIPIPDPGPIKKLNDLTGMTHGSHPDGEGGFKMVTVEYGKDGLGKVTPMFVESMSAAEVDDVIADLLATFG